MIALTIWLRIRWSLKWTCICSQKNRTLSTSSSSASELTNSQIPKEITFVPQLNDIILFSICVWQQYMLINSSANKDLSRKYEYGGMRHLTFPPIVTQIASNQSEFHSCKLQLTNACYLKCRPSTGGTVLISAQNDSELVDIYIVQRTITLFIN